MGTGLDRAAGLLCVALVASSASPAFAQDTNEQEPEPAPAPAPAPPGAIEAPAKSPEDHQTPDEFDKPPCEREVNQNRSVGCHQFIYPAAIESAFIATYIGVRLRLATTHVPNLPTDFGSTSLDAITVAETLDLGLKLTNWLGLQGTAGGRSLIGTNLPSFVYEGATFEYFAGLYGILRLFRSDNTGTQLSLRGGVAYSQGQVASLFPLFSAPDARVALRDILQGSLRDVLTTPIWSSQWLGTLALAQAVSPLFGIQVSAGAGYTTATADRFDFAIGDRREIHVDGVAFRFGGAVSADFDPLHVPVAVMLEYGFSREQSTTNPTDETVLDSVHRLYAGVYYSGRSNLQLGLGAGAELGLSRRFTNVGLSEKPRSLLTQLVLRYVW